MTIKKRTIIKAFLIFFVALLALFVSAWFIASYQLSHLETYKESITQALGKSLNRNVTYEKGKAVLTIRKGLALEFTNVMIPENDRSSNLLSIKTAFFRVNIFPLLRNRLVLREVILDQPRLLIKRDRSGVLNIADLLKKENRDSALEFKKLTISKGLVTFADETASERGLVTSLDNLNCKIDQPFWGNTSRFRITANVGEAKNKAELLLTGTYHPAPSGKPVYESKVKASIRIKGMDMKHYGFYLKNYTPLEQLAGRFDLDTTFSGSFSDFTSKGTVTLKDALMRYPQVFRGPVQSKNARVEYTVTRNAGNLKVDIARLALDHVTAAGHFAIYEMDKEDPLLEAAAATSTFSLKEIRSYIPWDIIPGGVGGFIEAHVKEGNFRLTEGKLNGRLSQIKNIMKQENAGVLSVRAEVNNGVFVTGGTSPAFRDISGTMVLINRQFLLRKMKGRFGMSPCTLEGGISDFALPGPVVYTAYMNIQPVRDEVLWLLGKQKFGNIGFNGLSTLLLSGKGPSDNFRISAHWNLANVNYVFPEIMEKPKGRQNQIAAEITVNENDLSVDSFKYDLPPVTITGSAMRFFVAKTPLSLNIQSKTFNIREAVPILPILRKVDPAGKCLIALAGAGDLNDLGSMQWKGNVSLTDVSLKPPGGVKPVKGLTGNIAFKGKKMETPLFKAHIGESAFQGKCVIDDFHKTKVVCRFGAASLQAADLGWQNLEGVTNFSDVRGRVAVEDKHIRVDRLSLRSGKSSFNLSGDVWDFANPKITLSLKSPYINWDDVVRLMSITQNQKQGTDSSSGSRMEINAAVQVDTGVFVGVDFKKLNTGLKLSGGNLRIETLDAGLFEGNLNAKGRVDIRSGGQNYYDLGFSFDKISLEKLKIFLDIQDRTVTGNMSITGKITATGGNVDDLKKSAVGTVKIQSEKGVLKKFSVLSKIFSLLNVYQLFKFKLPDMATDGMPYNSITANLSLKGGVISTDDFFIDSNAMQISGSGKVDYIKKELDFVAGVHPLQTLDRIAAKIPIAGWLITDEKGNLITVHFKADGSWDNPNVRPMPARSISKGTQDIFRRLFKLPGKLVTDTGEVILGR